jgi:molecular chaperone GrpE
VTDAQNGATEGAGEGTEHGAEQGEDFRSKYLYAVAETENTRKRLQRRSDDAVRAVKKRLLVEFLPVLDNLERALAYDDSEGMRAGLDATLRAFEAALQREGVAPISTAGKPFDPTVAEAIATQPAAGVADETVIDEAQRGYTVDGELLRPARVVVAKNASP